MYVVVAGYLEDLMTTGELPGDYKVDVLGLGVETVEQHSETEFLHARQTMLVTLAWMFDPSGSRNAYPVDK